MNPGAPAGQRGLVLFGVLMVGVVIAVIAAVTTVSLKRSQKDAGAQRKSFQARHAAEAGVEHFRKRLDQLDFCQPWFGHAESLMVVGLLQDHVVPLPSPFGGPARGFRIQNARIEPGIRPLGIRFESVGGMLRPDGTLDPSGDVPVVCRLKLVSAAEYLFFLEEGQQWFNYNNTGVDVITGKVFSAGGFRIGDETTFLESVEYGGEITYFGDPSTVTFKKGTQNVSAHPFVLDHIHVAGSDPRPWCGSGPARTYEDLARGAVANEGRGVWINNGRERILIDLDEVMLSGSTVHVDIWEFDTLRAGSRGPFLGRASLPRSQFNGIIAVNGDVFVQGTLRNLSLTIASTDDVFVTGNIACVGAESGGDRRVTLGMIAQDDFHIWWHTPTRLSIEASVIAEDDPVAAEKGYFPSIMYAASSWGALGTRTSHPGIDANGNPASNVGPANWSTNFKGGVLSRRGGGFLAVPPMFPMWDGATGWPSGSYAWFEIDKDNVYSPPPRFPIMSGNGASRWDVIGMQER